MWWRFLSVRLLINVLWQAFRAERASWRAVVHLNVVRSIRIILEAMADVQAQQMSQNSSPIRTHPPELAHSPSISSLASRHQHPPLTSEHLKLKLRLSPLVQVEEALIRKLTPVGSGELEATQLRVNISHADRARALEKEVTVNSQFPWKGMFHKMITRNSSDDVDYNDPDVSNSFASCVFPRVVRRRVVPPGGCSCTTGIR